MKRIDWDKLKELVIKSERIQGDNARRSLCAEIGIEASKLKFLSDTSESDFAILLIRRLRNQKQYLKLVKLCNQIESALEDGGFEQPLIDIRTKLEELISQQEELPDGDEESPDGDKQPKPPPSPEHQSIIELVNKACVSIQRACDILGQHDIRPIDCDQATSDLESVRQIVRSLWKELNKKLGLFDEFEELCSNIGHVYHYIDEEVPHVILQLKQFRTDCLYAVPRTHNTHQQILGKCKELRDTLLSL